jgi:hypothetical protein
MLMGVNKEGELGPWARGAFRGFLVMGQVRLTGFSVISLEPLKLCVPGQQRERRLSRHPINFIEDTQKP